MPRKLNKAERRYLMRFAPAMTAYVVVFLAVTYLFRFQQPTGWMAFAAAAAPAVPILGVILAMGMYLVEETDEYLRLQHAKASIIATGLTLAVATFWGFLEQFGQAPHAPAFYVFILFCASLGLARGCIKAVER